MFNLILLVLAIMTVESRDSMDSNSLDADSQTAKTGATLFDLPDQDQGLSALIEKSPGSHQRTTMVFHNNVHDSVTVYWIDFQGKERKYKTLYWNQKYTQHTYVGHAWVVRVDREGFGYSKNQVVWGGYAKPEETFANIIPRNCNQLEVQIPRFEPQTCRQTWMCRGDRRCNYHGYCYGTSNCLKTNVLLIEDITDETIFEQIEDEVFQQDDLVLKSEEIAAEPELDIDFPEEHLEVNFAEYPEPEYPEDSETEVNYGTKELILFSATIFFVMLAIVLTKTKMLPSKQVTDEDDLEKPKLESKKEIKKVLKDILKKKNTQTQLI